MRHQSKKHHLGKAQDQRNALLRSLATELILHGEIKTTMARAKALKPYAENIITLAKQGTLHSRRLAAKFIFDKETGKFMNFETGEVLEGVEKADKEQKAVAQTILRKLFVETGKKYANRNGGYTRIYRMPPRRGDAAEMALIQLV
ncbi:MAG: 50S ribosomal protein L17 [Candidatus Gastranaerophilaceae bacterium]|jgi:ribosomal protein L17|nr:50S ribosomal protein L17 [Clostridium sp. CAG:306]DAB24585.1 MAG TPA: 50S ribosomal protein L17 [Candidatus Gastranaerophilales bacterium HUM_21]